MALDFPSSPTNGQTFNGYTYDAAKSVWAINASTITNMTVSDTAPSNPLSGDSWFDSTTGYVFVYYTDANSSQWVQTTGAYIDTALTNRVTTVESQVVPAGSLFPFAGASSPAGYALCDGASVSTTGTYARLFAVIGYTYGGSGASFNLPDLSTRVPTGYQAPTSLGTATITIATPGVVTLASHGLATGQIVYFTTTGALPTGITATTGRYWAIVLTSSTFRLASSLANALAGTAITTSGSQSGTHTVFSADFELGRSNGEESHTQTLTELVSHNHSNADGNSPTLLSAAGANYGVQYSATTTGATGGGLPMNNMQPYLTTNYIIKL